MSDRQPNLTVRVVTYILCAVAGAVLTMAANTYRIEHDPNSKFFVRIINRIREEREERQKEREERRKAKEDADNERRRRREVETERDGLLEKLRRRTGEPAPKATGEQKVVYLRPDYESWGEVKK